MSRQPTAKPTTTPGTRSAPARKPAAHGDITATAAAATAAPRRMPTNEEIRRRAYELFVARRGIGGSPEADWLQAERELGGR